MPPDVAAVPQADPPSNPVVQVDNTSGKPWEKYKSTMPTPAGGSPKPWDKYTTPTAPPTAPSISDVVGSIPTTLGQASTHATEVLGQRAAAAKQAYRTMTGHLPDVDYNSGTTWTDAMMLARADNDKERRRYLDRVYGSERVHQDPSGRFYIETADGKKVAPGATGFWSGLSAHLAAESAPLVGAVQGGVSGGEMGAAAGPWGALFGGALGAGIGAMSGKTLDEITKEVTGLGSDSLGESVKAIGKEGEAGMAGEGGGRLVSGLIGRVTRGGLPNFITGATAESKGLGATALRGGAAPPMRSIVPHMGVSQWHQALSNKLVGPFKEEANLHFIQEEVRAALKESGVPDSEMPRVMAEINEPTAAMSTRELGNTLGSNVVQHQEALTSAVESAEQAASSSLDVSLTNVKRLSRMARPPGDLATDVSESLFEARKDFSRSAKLVFQHVDSLFGNQPIVPTQVLRQYAQNLANKLPKDKYPLVHEIADLPDALKPSEMQEYVTKLRELGEPADLAAAGITKAKWRQLQKLADSSFDQGVRGGTVDPRAVNALRGAKSWYREGIRKFEDTTFDRAIDLVRSGMPPEPSVIAKLLLRPGYVNKAIELRNTLGADVWNRVGTEYFRGLLEDASAAGQINGLKLKNALADQGKTLDVAIGSKAATAARTFADQAAALDGKIPTSVLHPSDPMVSNIERMNLALQQQTAFLKDNFLSELAQPGFMHDEALNFVVQPHAEERLEAAFDWFGEGSDQIAEIRQTFMTQLLKQSMKETQSGIKTVDPDRIFSSMRKYTPRQQEMLMPAGLADDVTLLARHARYLFPRTDSDMSAGLAAGAIKAAMPFGAVTAGMGHYGPAEMAISAYAYAVGWGWILSRPATIRWISQGLQSGTPGRVAADQTLRAIFDAAALGAIPDTMGLQEP